MSRNRRRRGKNTRYFIDQLIRDGKFIVMYIPTESLTSAQHCCSIFAVNLIPSDFILLLFLLLLMEINTSCRCFTADCFQAESESSRLRFLPATRVFMGWRNRWRKCLVCINSSNRNLYLLYV